jgi:hypothetical protein
MEIVFATNDDDWEGLYINGKLVSEGHKLSFGDFAEAFGISYAKVSVEIDGSLPQNLNDLTQTN